MQHAPWLYRSFKRSLSHIVTGTPCDEEVLDFVTLRCAILVDLSLPASERNIDRLMLCAMAGLSLSVFMRDVDVALVKAAEGDTGALPASANANELPQRLFGSCFENQPPVSASRSAVNASMRN